MSEKFVAWLEEELERRSWSREEVARRAGIHSSVLTNIVSGRATVGVETARKIAVALDVSPVVVFRLAGLLPSEEEEDDIYDRLRHEFEQIDSIEDRETILRMVRAYRQALADDRPAHRDSTPKARRTAKGTT
jgi:transcriptional regulator with XRE-family HTH domain